MTVGGKLIGQFERLYGVPWRNEGQVKQALVGLVGSFTELERDPDETVSASFEIIRFRNTTTSCGVSWRVEGTGDEPVLPEHFHGGVLPEGIVAFAPGMTSVPSSIILSAGAEPPTALTGRILLEEPESCEISADRAFLNFSIKAGEIVVGDAFVGLVVSFSELEVPPVSNTVLNFTVERTGYLAQASTVGWVVEGTGTTPITGALFSGGVLPSGTASFVTLDPSESASFTLLAGTPPPERLTGRIRLRDPVGCIIDPLQEIRAIAVQPAVVVPAAVLGLSVSFSELDRHPTDPTPYTFQVVRSGNAALVCSVQWRLEGTGTAPITGASFSGGVLPSGTVNFVASDLSENASFTLLAGADPAARLSGRIVLHSAVNAVLNPETTTRPISIRPAEVVPDAVVGLIVGFNELDRDPAAPLVAAFQVVRSGNEGIGCSVSWRVEGTGTNPVLAADFVGGVLPSGVETFSAAELVEDSSFSLTAGADPTTRRTGRILLHTPVTCRLDPAAVSRDFSLRPAAVVTGVWDFVAANMAVHTPAGQEGRVTWLPAAGTTPARVEVAGAANVDTNNIALWFEEVPFQDYEIRLRYQKNEDLAPADAGGRFAQFWGGYEGTTGGRPANVTTWTTAHYRPGGTYDDVGDSVYGDFGRGWRVSFDTETTTEANRNEARLVVWTAGTQTRPTPQPDPPTFPMAGATTVYDLVLRKEGNQFTISKTPGGEAVQYVHSEITRRTRIGFRLARGRGGILGPTPGQTFIRDLGGVVIPEVRLTDFNFLWPTLWKSAPSSDNWPMTQFADGQIVGHWGDGNGFAGGRSTASGPQRVSFGIGQIGNVSAGSSATTITGSNLIGGQGSVAQFMQKLAGDPADPDNPTALGAKSAGLLALGGNLFVWTQPADSPFDLVHLRRAAQNSNVWTKASWTFSRTADGIVAPNFMQAGPNLNGESTYLYVYAGGARNFAETDQGQGGRRSEPLDIFLLRCLKSADPLVKANWEFYSSTNPASPTWSTSSASKQAVWIDNAGGGVRFSAFKNIPLGLYLVIYQHGNTYSGNFTLLQAPTPWGPFTQVARKDAVFSGGSVGSTTFSVQVVPGSVASNGMRCIAVGTGRPDNDAFGAVDMTFSTTTGGGGGGSAGPWPEIERLADVPSSRRTNITGPGTYNGGPGHHFVLPASGPPITGPITINATATQANPCVLRCDNDGIDPRAWRVITAPIHLRGTGATVSNLVFSPGGYGNETNRINFYGRWGRVSRVELTNRPINGYYDGGQVFEWSGGTDTYIDACDFNSRLGQWWANCTDGDLGQRIDIEWCLFEDLHTHPQGGVRGSDSPTSSFWGWLAQGKGRGDENQAWQFRVRNNLFLRAHDRASELFEIKGSEFSFESNTIENAPQLGQRFRHGHRCRSIDNNYIGGSSEITVRGGNHVFLNNGCSIDLWAGGEEYNNPQESPAGRPCAAFCTVGGNRGNVHVGRPNQGVSDVGVHDCIIAPATASRRDRNASVTLGQQNNNNFNTVIANADFGKTLVRHERASIGLRLPRRG